MKSPFRLTSSFYAWPCFVLCLLILMLMVGVQSASAFGNPVTGSIFTTKADGTQVNANIFDSKDAVYVNGGPQNEHSNGLAPDGTYYFQVTDPSGAVPLSTDDITCRQLVVSGGKIVGVPSGPAPTTCTSSDGGKGNFHAASTANLSNGEVPVQLCAQSGCPAGQPDYKDTTNAGGEYKVWITPVDDYNNCSNPNFGFCSSLSDTDNFKVSSPNLALIAVCKFNDQNDDGAQDNGEPLIPHWPITATGVVGDTGTGVTNQTDDSGCVSFSVNTFGNGNGTATVTLTEGTLGPDWMQTAPANGACTLTGDTVNAADSCSVSGGVITLTVSPGDTLNAPNFGNFNPNCTTGCTGQQILVTKTANPVITYTWNIQKSVDKSSIDTSGSATANYTVTVTHDSGTATMTGNIKISNPFGPDVSGITVTDAVSDANTDGGNCTVTTPAAVTNPNDGTITVATGTHVDATYSCTFTDVPAAGSNTNTATATWNSPASPVMGQATFDFSKATLVDNSVTVTDSLAGNLGSVTINGGAAADTCTTASSGFASNGSNLQCSVSGSTTTFTYSLTFNDPAGTCTTHNNTATFTTNTSGTTGNDKKSVQVCVGADLTVSKTAATSFTRTYNWTISKSANPATIDAPSGTSGTANYSVTASETGFTDSAWQVTGTITITNPNNWESITANVSDALDVGSNGTCTVTGGTGVVVPASRSQTLNYTCSFSAAPSPSKGTNTATATWDKVAASTPDGSAPGTAGYDFASATITRVNQTITPTDAFNGGSAVNLCTLDTTGPCTLTASDSTPFTSHTYMYSRSLNVPTATCTTYSNTASTGLTGAGQTASASVKVCGASPLTVTKTAIPSYVSNITKKANQTSPVEQAGATTLTYTITVTESGWKVSGNITVTNPNDWEAITANLSDTLSITGGSCSIAGGTTQIVPANNPAGTGVISPGYTCTFASAPAASGTNTATATWNAATFFTATGSATSGPVGFAFTLLTVTDQFNGGTTKTLGSNLVPAASYTFTDSYTVTPAPGTCATFPNVATITQTGQTANASVTVCNTNTGALTMGFWKNNNGQGIITKFCAGTGGLTLVQFLAGNGTTWPGFNPFKDDTATTCKTEATYVANAISGATCSSSTNTCNTMLRAQMLATALDVYFSDPTLGGNQIGAFNNLGGNTPALGGVAIDLSKICDGGDGGLGGSCPEDARRVFGICTGTNTPVAGCSSGVLGTTVLNMLMYSDFASSINGNPVATPNTGAKWYMQIKGLQVPAKDAFDSINNQIAPIAPSGVGTPSF